MLPPVSRRTLVIAEVGINHNGNVDLAMQLIDCASRASADLVKFQTFVSNRVVTHFSHMADYQARAVDQGISQLRMLERFEFDHVQHQRLINYCRSRNIGFFSSAFDNESLNYLSELGAERFKVPSGEITNLPYLRQLGAFGKPVILSTGMATLGEIESALDILEKAGTLREQITLLHCNTEYPTPAHDVNLRAMCSLREAFGVQVGYSDHTMGIEVPIAAVALGATVIEKHLTLDRSLPGPDHSASLEPGEFAAMVSAIRNIEQAMGDGIKRPSLSEAKNIPIVRKSLVALRAIRAGELFTPENVTTKRPGTGICPMRWDEVMGRVAVRDFAPNDFISL